VLTGALFKEFRPEIEILRASARKQLAYSRQNGSRHWSQIDACCVQAIQPTLEEMQAAVSKAGLMMVDVNRRISQWDQQRIMSSVVGGRGKAQIVSGSRPSSTKFSTRDPSLVDMEMPRASGLPGAATAEPGKLPGAPATEGAAALTVADTGQLRYLLY